MPELNLDESDRIEWALKAFKRKMQKSGILAELRRRRHYVKPGEARRLKSKAARQRLRRKDRKAKHHA
jgi:small subunit ribosomal protein S21